MPATTSKATLSSTLVITDAPSDMSTAPNKRKTPEDGNPLVNGSNPKKARIEASNSSNPTSKRRLQGEQKPGGLVILRASSRPPASSQDVPSSQPLPQTSHQIRPHSRSASVQPPQLRPPNANASKPPSTSNKRAASESRRIDNRELQHGPRSDLEIEEDVRQMEEEADALRRKSRATANGAIDPSFQFPPSRPVGTGHATSRERTYEVLEPLNMDETPKIKKNRMMRGEMPHPQHTPRRKSSISRGKRASSSFENTGVITQPHTSVADSTFYKHIDVELPEPQRAQQLLIWCTHRVMSEFVDQHAPASTSRRAPSAGKDPPLTQEEVQLLKGVQEDVIRMLAEKKVDTNVFTQPGQARPQEDLKENEQNVKNREREKRFNDLIHKAVTEKAAWAAAEASYKQRRTAVMVDAEKRERELMSAKAKGKQRATLDDIEKWESDLPDHFRDENGLGLARHVINNTESVKKSPLLDRIADLEYTADQLHALSHSALETTRIAEADLDRRFALLSLSLSARSQSLPSTHLASSSSSTALSSYIPPTVTRPPPTTDPQDLLRALSRVDAGRPQSQVGDAARRAAREVQRAADAGVGLSERRLTSGVPPPTPRKPPGTPRRATTPGRGR
ncbi:hypothetical protein K474DRAFT_50513 [Panus rudis PR-1116 ss-1]|nr:hypothetical protein K474DRAFT_50513 [Panus rudis PR-1116 ss-1]